MKIWQLFLTETQEGMYDGMISMFDMLMLIMLFGCGVYGLYSVIRLHREQFLFKNKFLYPGNCAPENCADVGGFIDFIQPRMLIFSILLLALGVLYALNAYLFLSVWVDYAMIAVPLAVFIWYAVMQNKAAKIFW